MSEMLEIITEAGTNRFGQTPSRPPRDSSGISFFKHHGLMAPGVRLMRRLRFPAKALLISLAFLAPLVWITQTYTAAKLELIGFTDQELRGVAQVRELAVAMNLAQERRRLSSAQAIGHPAPELSATEQALAKQLTRLKGLMAAHVESLKRIELANQKVAAPSEGIFRVYATHSQFVNELGSVATDLADDTNLTLDPDLDTYYLMSASVLDLPELTNAIAKMRGLAAAAAASVQGGRFAGTEMVSLDTTVERMSSALKHDLAKVIGAHPELKSELDPNAALKQVELIRDAAPESLTKHDDREVAHVVELGTDAVTSMWALQGRALDRLDGLLLKRRQGITRSLFGTFAVFALCLVVAAYLFYAFYKVLNGGMHEVEQYMKAIAVGDLSAPPEPWGKDEAADLMLTLGSMQRSLVHIVQEVRVQSDLIIQASFDIASGSSELTDRTVTTASSLQQAAASMEQIAVTVNQSSANADEAGSLAGQNAQVAAQGGDVMRQVSTTMDDIHAASSKIGEIIAVIEGIAFQTNILALNAAVEAARAGDHGRGFAVVASEVRALARRSSEAAKEIKALISTSVDKVESGTKVVSEANRAIQALVDNATQINALVSGITVGAKEQSDGLGVLVSAIAELNSATQQNANLASGTSGLADKLTDASSGLLQRVALFKLPGD